MKMNATKPKRTAKELVEKLENEKGIKFELMTKDDAENFLKERNNYMRVASYRKNYEKNKIGKYINLDFCYLVELSKLDMYFRSFILKMCIDIEHCLKVQVLKDIEENNTEDGYTIVNEFLNIESNKYIISNILRKARSGYSAKLIRHYFSYEITFDEEGNAINNFDCPAWFLMEIISFGDFIRFYLFYNERKRMENYIPEGIINSVKSLRNACAHNNCILHDLHKNPKLTGPKSEITEFVKGIDGISYNSRRNKLSNQFVMEFVSLIYVYEKVSSKELKDKTSNDLQKFFNGRLVKNIEYFEKQILVKSTINFLKKVVDFLKK